MRYNVENSILNKNEKIMPKNPPKQIDKYLLNTNI